MFGRGNSNQGLGSMRVRQRLEEEDRISQLPDSLICQILSHLSAKDSVRTSVLSPRWKSLWLWVPRLDLNSEEFLDFNAFVSFGDKFFDSDRVSCIEKVDLMISENKDGVDDTSYVTPWLDAAVKRKIQHLFVNFPPEPEFHEMPLTFFSCKTLVCLELFQASFYDADLSELKMDEVVSLPCLKTMYLENILYPNEATFERLVSSCPVLEEVTILGCVNDFANVFRVISRSLKKLGIELEFSAYNSGSGVVIDAPQLRILSICVTLPDSFIIQNMHPEAKFDILPGFGSEHLNEAYLLLKSSMIHECLCGISGVKELTISPDTFKVICLYSKFESVPQFRYLSRLHAKLLVPDLKWLTTFLESCPSLKSLILVWDGDCQKMCSDEIDRISFPSVPECLLSSLEFVDIKSSISGHVAEMKLVRYFLESSVNLKKLTLSLKDSGYANFISKELLKIPRHSVTCQVVLL